IAAAVPQRPVPPICAQCEKSHGGTVCFRVSGKCFNCGDAGHMSRECPKRRVQAVPGQASRPAKVFTVSAEEALPADCVTEGTILIYGFSARVLFDSGATDSFISAYFATLLRDQCDVTVSSLSSPLSVISPGGLLSVDHCMPEVDVSVDGHSLLALVHILEM